MEDYFLTQNGRLFAINERGKPIMIHMVMITKAIKKHTVLVRMNKDETIPSKLLYTRR